MVNSNEENSKTDNWTDSVKYEDMHFAGTFFLALSIEYKAGSCCLNCIKLLLKESYIDK